MKKMKKYGSRAQVYHGTCLSTRKGGLKKLDLFKDKNGRIKSKRASDSARHNFDISKYMQAGGTNGFFTIPQTAGAKNKKQFNKECNCHIAGSIKHKVQDHIENKKMGFIFPIKNSDYFIIRHNDNCFTKKEMNKICKCGLSKELKHQIKDHKLVEQCGGGIGSVFGKIGKGLIKGAVKGAKFVGSKGTQLAKVAAKKGVILGKRGMVGMKKLAVKGATIGKKGLIATAAKAKVLGQKSLQATKVGMLKAKVAAQDMAKKAKVAAQNMKNKGSGGNIDSNSTNFSNTPIPDNLSSNTASNLGIQQTTNMSELKKDLEMAPNLQQLSAMTGKKPDTRIMNIVKEAAPALMTTAPGLVAAAAQTSNLGMTPEQIALLNQNQQKELGLTSQQTHTPGQIVDPVVEKGQNIQIQQKIPVVVGGRKKRKKYSKKSKN